MSTLSRGHGVLRSSIRPQYIHPIPFTSSPCHFSTSAILQQSKPQTPAPTTVTTPQAHEINAPISTLPAEIDTPAVLPPSAPLPDKLKRFVNLGRAYLTFYKTGLKNVVRNYRASSPLRKSLNLPYYIPISPPRTLIPVPQHGQNKDHTGLDPSLSLGRGQFQLVRRSAQDMRRLIPFTMILIVCGEFTPLILPIFGGAITPATCRVPSQRQKERDRASARKSVAFQAQARAERSMNTPVVGSVEERELLLRYADSEWVAQSDAAAVLRACASFGLVKRHDAVGGALLASLVYRPRLRKHLQYLAVDEALMRRGGGVEKLSAEEVRIALDERGAGDVAAGAPSRAKAEVMERAWLKSWLELREGRQEKQ